MQSILIDNGAWEIKASRSEAEQPSRFFNGILRDKMKNKIHFCNQAKAVMAENFDARTMQIIHPQVRGLLQDSDMQNQIWKKVFSNIIDPSKDKMSENHLLDEIQSKRLLMTTQPALPEICQERYAEMVFEDFQFAELGLVTTHSMIYETAQNQKQSMVSGDNSFQSQHSIENQKTNELLNSPACLVIDSGFSFTYGVPFFNGIPMKQAALRIDVGGKLLTNYLIETISHKDFNLKGEIGLVNDMKEKTCYLAGSPKQFNIDMELSATKKRGIKNPLLKEYILPDYTKIKTGFIRTPETQIDQNTSIVNLKAERFQIPEVLFSPSDIGINEGGVQDMVKQISSSRVPSVMEPMVLSNIVIGGGNTKIPGFAKRLKYEIENGGRMNDLTDSINIHESEQLAKPDAAWRGMKIFSTKTEQIQDYCISRAQYEEEGQRILKKFYL